MLAGAMLHAHAVMTGELKVKQAAGIGVFNKYLGVNAARREAWGKQTKLFPSAVLARASMSGEWLNKAGQLLEATTDAAKRKALLGQVIAPHITNVTALFGSQIKERAGKLSIVKISDIASLLEWQMPEIELETVNIPAGKFPMGSTEDSTEQPVREATISAFRSGKYEVTNEQYGIYMGQTGYRAPEYWEDEKFGKDQPKNPVVGVDYDDANNFSLWHGRRLLTEAEGEYAARGHVGLIYPWGNKLDLSRVTFNTDRTSPVDAHPDGASLFFGVMGLSGNVGEWRADWHDLYDSEDLIDPKGPETGILRAIRGGSWEDEDSGNLRSAYRSAALPKDRLDFVGFRVAEDK
ncbi:hypothetical protein A2625_05375 [candidate division WOR-1 bacterium RIFCSPHIGHO2_01_FULL_53_15]|uniref:Sulfatase-modifying factor enzyme-like domain-containing protein n=1 Tax=candidate division WOR-1 bacterium RIFCSPHIGHO2_01_FULL_53_15 TaxID=1802564 RepID=A0A1F4Q3N4_UNCSA|nr:MAG: hypothetical protein A2625_05375 [candidate division WOR-1 bacterium RIFCSPHIGHO2_01_FULL_53_15]OGC13100.1 MAG: hypothetical protein A3D23_00320 [candidate division WOR-1 bacterium RIFCSPHIGHO2_02_FULL_53_26]